MNKKINTSSNDTEKVVNRINDINTNNKVLEYFDSEWFKKLNHWEKIAFFNYIAWKTKNPELQTKQWELLEYLESYRADIMTQSLWINTFIIDDIEISHGEEKLIFDEFLKHIDLSYDTIHRAIKEKEENQSKIASALNIFKLYKSIFEGDTENKSLKDAIKNIRLVALRWTHGDEIWAFQGSQLLEKEITTYIVNPEAVSLNQRESDEDINRKTSEWSNAWERKKDLINNINNLEGEKYILDFHNCNWSAKLWCIDEYHLKHELMAKALWLDALLIFDKEISSWTVISDIQKKTYSNGMIVEVGKDIDTNWRTTMQIAKSLLEVNHRLCLTQKDTADDNNLSIGDLQEILGIDKNKKIPIIEISILKDSNWKEISNLNYIDKNIPSHCIQYKQWLNKYIVIRKKDWSYPDKNLLDKALFQM